MNHELIVNAIIIIFVVIVVFALVRELICWYFKINERVDLQKKVLAELVKLNLKGGRL
jgi:hypothetical protein